MNHDCATRTVAWNIRQFLSTKKNKFYKFFKRREKFSFTLYKDLCVCVYVFSRDLNLSKKSQKFPFYGQFSWKINKFLKKEKIFLLSRFSVIFSFFKKEIFFCVWNIAYQHQIQAQVGRVNIEYQTQRLFPLIIPLPVFSLSLICRVEKEVFSSGV